MRKLYFLIDGDELYLSQFMNEEELEQAEEDLGSSGAGNAYWYVPASPEVASLPKNEVYKHIPIERLNYDEFPRPINPC